MIICAKNILKIIGFIFISYSLINILHYHSSFADSSTIILQHLQNERDQERSNIDAANLKNFINDYNKVFAVKGNNNEVVKPGDTIFIPDLCIVCGDIFSLKHICNAIIENNQKEYMNRLRYICHHRSPGFGEYVVVVRSFYDEKLGLHIIQFKPDKYGWTTQWTSTAFLKKCHKSGLFRKYCCL